MKHIPVLLEESIKAMNLQAGDIVVDCTVNRGGHALEIAKIIGQSGTLICLDLDSQALTEAKIFLEKNLNKKDLPKIFFIEDNFRNLKKILEGLSPSPFLRKGGDPEYICESGVKPLLRRGWGGLKHIDALIADLGVSSEEIDNSGRGFTFQKDEPLLMTFKLKVESETLKENTNTEDILTAKEIVNNWAEDNLFTIISFYGEEKYAKKIAKNICQARKLKEIKTTFDLVKIIQNSVPNFYQNSRINCATKTFQALRIAVNDELKAEEELLISLPEILKVNGRASLITFHSGEDRIVKKVVKNFRDTLHLIKFNKLRQENKTGPDFLQPNRSEIKNNVRSRSAKLRVVERNPPYPQPLPIGGEKPKK